MVLMTVQQVRRLYNPKLPQAPGEVDPLETYLEAADEDITSRFGPHGTPLLMFEREISTEELFLEDGLVWYPNGGRPGNNIVSVALDGTALAAADYRQPTDRRCFALNKYVDGRLTVSYYPLNDDDRRKDVLLRLVRLAGRDSGVQVSRSGGGVSEVRLDTERERMKVLDRLDYRQGPPIYGGAGGDHGGGGDDHHIFILVSTTAAITAADIPGGNRVTGNAGAVPTFTGQRYVVILRPVSAGNFQSLYLYAAGSRNTQNQIGAWTQQTDTIRYEGLDHYVLRSDGPLNAPSGYTLWVEVV